MAKQIITSSIFTILAATMIASCSENTFTGEGSSYNLRRGGTPPCTATKTKNCTPQKVTPSKDETFKDETLKDGDSPMLANDGGGVCLLKAPTIDFVFVMDVSGSMSNESAAVQASFSQMANELASITIPGLGKVSKVRFGLVTYEDSIIFQAPLRDKVDLVQLDINANFRAVERGSDSEEAGLFATNTAMQIANDGSPAVKVVFIMTDAFSHDGSGSPFNHGYSTAAIEQQLADPNMKLSFIYSASDFHGGNGNNPPGISNAVQQWSQLRSRAQQIGGHTSPLGRDFNIEDMGGLFGSKVNFAKDIPADISAKLRKCK